MDEALIRMLAGLRAYYEDGATSTNAARTLLWFVQDSPSLQKALMERLGAESLAHLLSLTRRPEFFRGLNPYVLDMVEKMTFTAAADEKLLADMLGPLMAKFPEPPAAAAEPLPQPPEPEPQPAPEPEPEPEPAPPAVEHPLPPPAVPADFAAQGRTATCRDILRATATTMLMRPQDITKPSKCRMLITARQTSMLLCILLKDPVKGSLPIVAKEHKRDHTTVLHALRNMSARLRGGERDRPSFIAMARRLERPLELLGRTVPMPVTPLDWPEIAVLLESKTGRYSHHGRLRAQDYLARQPWTAPSGMPEAAEPAPGTEEETMEEVKEGLPPER